MNLQDYYLEANIYEPRNLQQREFGVCLKKLVHPQKNPIGMWRHLSFTSMERLRTFLVEHQPTHVFFSAAKYENPSARPVIDKENPIPMLEAKGYIESDLIFDIDNDHLHTPTMVEAAYHATKLYWILRNRFGLKDMLIKFSGSRGYHVHVFDDCIQNLNSHERREIADYFQEFLPYKDKYGCKIYNKNYVCIDAPITITPNHLIRLPGSIHGKTMKECRIMNLDG